jgi:hypothetical protein
MQIEDLKGELAPQRFGDPKILHLVPNSKSPNIYIQRIWLNEPALLFRVLNLRP